MQPQTAVVD